MLSGLRALHPCVGSEASGLDLRTIDGAGFEAIRAALLERPLLVFRDQDLSPAELVAVTRHFGEPERFAGHRAHDLPEIRVITNRRGVGEIVEPYWHIDGMFQPDPPSLTLLYAVDVPDEGGDTLFADARAAYEALEEEDREALGRLRAVFGNGVQHPVVRTHPLTGRAAIAGLSEAAALAGVARDEALRFSRQLSDHLSEPAWLYRHRYRPGDLVIWDNASVLHSATDLPPPEARRLMLRTTVRGEAF